MSAFPNRSANPDRRVVRVELSHIEPATHQARHSFDPQELHSLAESIRQFGLISPLLVRRKSGGGYELIAGERRLRALKLLGWSHADVLISAACDQNCALMGLVENLEREDLHFLDEAEACRNILREYRLSQEELAAALCRSPSALANLLRTLRLGTATKDFIRENKLSERHARALLQLPEGQQLHFARKAVQEQLSVRRLEALIEAQLKTKTPAQKPLDRLLKDHRLVINAFKDTVRQLRRIGVPASSRVEPHDDYYDIIVTVKLPQPAE